MPEMLIPCDEVNIFNTFRVMIILGRLLLLSNLHLKLLSTHGTGADKLLSTQRVNEYFSEQKILVGKLCVSAGTQKYRFQAELLHVKDQLQ